MLPKRAVTRTHVLSHSVRAFNAGTPTPAGLRVPHLSGLFTTFRATRAPAQFLVKPEAFCAQGSISIRWVTRALAFDGIPAVVERTRHWSCYTVASTVFFGVPLGSVIAVCRFNHALARTTRVIGHSDCGIFIWDVVQFGWGWRPRYFAHYKVEIFFLYKVKKEIFIITN